MGPAVLTINSLNSDHYRQVQCAGYHSVASIIMSQYTDLERLVCISDLNKI